MGQKTAEGGGNGDLAGGSTSRLSFAYLNCWGRNQKKEESHEVRFWGWGRSGELSDKITGNKIFSKHSGYYLILFYFIFLGIQLTVLKTRVNNAFYFQKVGVKLHSKKMRAKLPFNFEIGTRTPKYWLITCMPGSGSYVGICNACWFGWRYPYFLPKVIWCLIARPRTCCVRKKINMAFICVTILLQLSMHLSAH